MSASSSLAATIKRVVVLDRGICCWLSSSHFQLPAQNPIQEPEQPEARTDQDQGVIDEHADRDAWQLPPENMNEVALLRAEKDVRLSAAAIVALLHLRVGGEVGDFLVHVQLLA